MKNPFTQENILRVVEPLVYGKRKLMLVILLLLTSWFGYEASKTHVDAGFEKSIPLEHPYMKVLKKYQNDFGGGNTILVALINKDGSPIYEEKFLDTLKKATDEVFFLPGIDRSKVTSIFTPNVRYIEVVEGGFAGGNVIPATYKPTEDMFDLVKSNVGKAGIIGRLVTENEDGAMIQAELLEFDPVTGEKLDYERVADDLEKIREQFQDEDISVHIIGFAKVIGDVTDASAEVAFFFAVALVMTMVLLWAYTGSFKMSVVVLVCSLVAVVWEFGLLTLAGFGLDPFAILVPFLILSVSTSHGVQYVNAWVAEIDSGLEPYEASLKTFRRLAIPGTTALITDVAGFLTILLIEIDIIQEMALNAAFGMAAIIVTNKILCPIWLTYINIGDLDKFREKQIRRENMGDGLFKFMAKITRPKPAVVTLVICGVLLGWSFWKYADLQVGDAQRGVPELWPDSRYNKDSNKIVDNFAIGTDILKVIAETKAEACIDYEVMEEIDRFTWHMENTEGVQSVISLVQIAKQVNAGFNEGAVKFNIVPRNRYVLSQAITPVPTSSGLLNSDCSAMAVLIFTEDHKATTIHHIVDAVKKFDADNSGTEVSFALASGNVGVMAATNEVVEAKEKVIVYYVYAVIILFLWMSWRSISGVICVTIPLYLVSQMAYAVMATLDIGMKVATLPVIALAVGIGVDYGIYIYATLREGYKDFHLSLEDAMYRTLRKTGKAVLFTGVALGGSVATWLMSDLKFQADMGIMLVFMFTANMFGALLVIPALAYFLMNYDVPEEKKSLDDVDESKSGAH
ncbi:MAG: efflux RND transporter permease subunit [Salinisphaeraceae bacterium]|nr:efflux RND transporter permease subunit [Salinisphaeraceae bacterium]